MNLNFGSVNYRSVADLNSQIVGMASRLPREIEVIVGVPRSGLLAGSLLALHLNLPLTDLEGFIQGRMLAGGARLEGRDLETLLHTSRTVLVIDDSVATGAQLKKVKERLGAAGLPHKILYAAVYVKPDFENVVDFAGEAVPVPRVFEWNFMHHGRLSEACMAVENVLYREPQASEGDEDAYAERLAHVEPLHLPTKPVGWLVSSGPETRRAPLQAWLADHNVRYEELILAAKGARPEAGDASFKADVYRKTGARMFIEGDAGRAADIANLSGRPVLCMDTREMFRPGPRPKALSSDALDQAVSTARMKARRRFRRFLKQLNINM